MDCSLESDSPTMVLVLPIKMPASLILHVVSVYTPALLKQVIYTRLVCISCKLHRNCMESVEDNVDFS